MTQHYPRIRPYGVHAPEKEAGERLLAREVIHFAFYMPHDHPDLAAGVSHAFNCYMNAVGEGSDTINACAFGHYSHGPLSNERWKRIRELLLPDRPFRYAEDCTDPYRLREMEKSGNETWIHLGNGHDRLSGFKLTYSARIPSRDREPSGYDVSYLEGMLPTEYLEEHGPAVVRKLMLDLAFSFTLLFLAGCATGFPVVSTQGPTGAPSQYAQSTDSATAACLRNPACYKTLPGEEAVIPWVSRAVDAAHAATSMSVMLEDADIKVVEWALTDCAQKANEQVNKEDEELQGREPTREQCRQVVRMEGGKEVTRAMELGARKHEVALDCVRNAFAERFTQNVRVEPTYQKDFSTGLWRWVDPKQVEEWLQLGLTSMLWGALVPDIVIHVSGDPNQARHVYDFKFPCPAENPPSWRTYITGQPHYPHHQGTMYKKALLEGKLEPRFVTPEGIK